jgi:ABC-type transport system involved in multi-copper enzyme maturation permease subunit
VKRILAIAGLTWKSAFRYRLFWILAALLAGAVVGLPLLLKDDGTAKGLVQILLTYTLSAVAALLGMATLWLSCGTLARDIEECQLQMVTVKPISRWQVWLGKWLGILALNAMLLTLSGTAIFILLQWRAVHLPPDEQKVLRDEIFVARASMKEREPDLKPQIDQKVRQRIAELEKTDPTELNKAEILKQVTEEVKAASTGVPPGYGRFWVIDLHTLPERTQNEAFQVRVKFHASDPNPEATYDTYWIIGPPDSPRVTRIRQVLPPDSFQEFQVPPHLLDNKGRLIIDFYNANNASLMFPIEDGFELLYYENSFGVNFIRGITILLCWLALLAAIGLAAASQLTFPVAAFTSMAILLMGLSSGTLQTVVEQGTITSYNSAAGGFGHSPLDLIFVPVFHGALKIIQLVEGFSPIDFLSTGRSITWTMLGLAVAQIVLLLGGIFCAIGIILFSRRELATAQGNS